MERQKTLLECMSSSVTEANSGEGDMADSSDSSEAVNSDSEAQDIRTTITTDSMAD